MLIAAMPLTPAKAEPQTYEFLNGSASAWQVARQHCMNPTVWDFYADPNEPGIDGKAVDVATLGLSSTFRGVRVDWSSTTPPMNVDVPNVIAVYTAISIQAMTRDCKNTGPAPSAYTRESSFTFIVPGDAVWLVFSANFSAKVQFTIERLGA